jgi:hypothetical protein
LAIALKTFENSNINNTIHIIFHKQIEILQNKKRSSFGQTCFVHQLHHILQKFVKSKSKVVECKSHLINETKTFHQKFNTQKRKSPNTPMITIAMETLKKIKSNHKTIMVP